MTDTWPDGTPRPPLTICWHCDQPLDAASNMPGQDHALTPGSVSLCLYCGAVAIFGPELLLYPPSREELEEMEKDRDFIEQYMQFAWARQYLMIQTNLLRRGEDPDR